MRRYVPQDTPVAGRGGHDLQRAAAGRGVGMSSMSDNVRVDLCGCVDPVGAPTETVLDLFVTLLAMAKDTLPPPDLDLDEGDEGDEGTGTGAPARGTYYYGASQVCEGDLAAAGASQAARSDLRDRPPPAPAVVTACEAIETFKCLWTLANSCARTEFPKMGFSTVGVASGDLSAYEVGRLRLLQECCHAAMVCVTALPATFGDVVIAVEDRCASLARLEKARPRPAVSHIQAHQPPPPPSRTGLPCSTPSCRATSTSQRRCRLPPRRAKRRWRRGRRRRKRRARYVA